MVSNKSSKLGPVLLIIGVVILGMILFRSFEVATKPVYREITSALEQSNGLGINGTAAYTYADGAHRVVLLTENTFMDKDNHWTTEYNPHSWNSLLDDDWQPTSISEVELIAYLEKEGASAIGTVHYYGGPDITRYMYKIKVVLVEAKTNRLVDSVTLWGSEPREGGLTEPKGLTSIYGGHVEFSALEEWLKEFVFPLPLPKEIVWKYKLDGSVYSSPVVVDGRVYVGTFRPGLENHIIVYCLNASSSDVIWRYQEGGSFDTSLVVADGRVYFSSLLYLSQVYASSGDCYVYCLDALSGGFIWKYQVGGVIQSIPTIADGKVYVSSDDCYVYCLDALSGGLIRKFQVAGLIQCSPAVADGMVYVSSNDSHVYCLNASLGQLVWRYRADGIVFASPVVADGRVYVGYNHIFDCLNASSGSSIWKYQPYGWIQTSSVVAYGKAYVASNGDINCYDAGSGVEIWVNNCQRVVRSSPIIAEGRVYMTAEDESVYCLDAFSGTFLWEYPTGGSIFSSPAVADGRVFICSNEGSKIAPTSGSVCCIDPSLID